MFMVSILLPTDLHSNVAFSVDTSLVTIFKVKVPSLGPPDLFAALLLIIVLIQYLFTSLFSHAVYYTSLAYDLSSPPLP